MIIHWQPKNAGPTAQVFEFKFNSITFTSAPLAVVSAEGKKVRRFIVNVNRMGLR